MPGVCCRQIGIEGAVKSGNYVIFFKNYITLFGFASGFLQGKNDKVHESEISQTDNAV
jgi:hypothetical protein